MKVNEIFFSLQGEGLWSGTPMIFVRLSGCNLNCSFCDTKHETFTELDYDDILNQVKRFNCRRICITGGEPFIHEDLDTLCHVLHRHQFRVHVETNGTVRRDVTADWITCSPKPDTEKALWHSSINEYKILVDSSGPLTIIPECPQPVFLQPVDPGPFTDGDGWFTSGYLARIAPALEAAYALQAKRPELRLGLQLHKLLGRR